MTADRMRILLYNFVQPEEAGAGGVGVYLGNLARALVDAGHRVITMSSGDRYTLLRQQPRMTFGHDRHDRAIVLNSPVVAPAVFSFDHPDAYLDSAGLDFVPAELRRRYGEIDVFHFQNIEGLTQSFFRVLRAEFPQARIVYSVHNYHFQCSRVTLWYQNRIACRDYREGAACRVCGGSSFDLDIVRRERRLAGSRRAHPRLWALGMPAFNAMRFGLHTARRLRRGAAPPAADAPEAPMTTPAATYARFRHANNDLMRDVFDDVLAVSQRTRQVVIDRGAPAGKIAVSYIGTAHKQAYERSRKIGDIAPMLHLGFIGYMTLDKGFGFLLDCLEALPDALAADIAVTVAARNTDPAGHARVLALASRFRQLRYFDGYTHDSIDAVLDGVNLGLIPVLWEDNLPQTAIELVSRGIPILTSDHGGAQEIADDPRFVFPAGSHAAFIERVSSIAARQTPLSAFWEGSKRIFSMDEHLADLMRYYRPRAGTAAA